MIILNMEMPPNCFDCRLAVSDCITIHTNRGEGE